MKVLHLLGATEDNGGILSTLRSLDGAIPGIKGAVWVNQAFAETRQPRLDFRRSRHALDESGNHLLLAWRAWRSFTELHRLLQQEPFDILHAHSRGCFAVALLAASRSQLPVVFTNHTYARRIGLYRWGAQRPGLTTVLLTPNMARHYGLLPEPGRIELIPEACADACFTRRLREPARRPDGIIRLVGIGNIVRWKKWDLAVRALGELPEAMRRRFRLDIWGPTPADPDAGRFAGELSESVAGRGLTHIVQLHGPTNDVPARLVDADWFFLPSTNEPCSLALLEALAQGVPAIVSNSGGNVDIVQRGLSGLFFEPDDPASLARQLEAIAAGNIQTGSPASLRQSVRPYAASEVGQAYQILYSSRIARTLSVAKRN